ncbi:hypothetical protein LCGC14_2547240 [marine sediment metagenome]|uniref:Uncharacterized protein n=1 Tax=marine sediment metagenome TaxID=412755 RepID=A0A0F9BBT0_9ZZZZ
MSTRNNLADQVEEFYADLPEDLRPDDTELRTLMRNAIATHIRQLKVTVVEGLFNYKMTMKANEEQRGSLILTGLRRIKSQLRDAHTEWVAAGGDEDDEELESEE